MTLRRGKSKALWKGTESRIQTRTGLPKMVHKPNYQVCEGTDYCKSLTARRELQRQAILKKAPETNIFKLLETQNE